MNHRKLFILVLTGTALLTLTLTALAATLITYAHTTSPGHLTAVAATATTAAVLYHLADRARQRWTHIPSQAFGTATATFSLGATATLAITTDPIAPALAFCGLMSLVIASNATAWHLSQTRTPQQQGPNMTVRRYRSKTVEIHAIQLTADNTDQVKAWILSNGGKALPLAPAGLAIDTPEGRT